MQRFGVVGSVEAQRFRQVRVCDLSHAGDLPVNERSVNERGEAADRTAASLGQMRDGRHREHRAKRTGMMQRGMNATTHFVSTRACEVMARAAFVCDLKRQVAFGFASDQHDTQITKTRRAVGPPPAEDRELVRRLPRIG